LSSSVFASAPLLATRKVFGRTGSLYVERNEERFMSLDKIIVLVLIVAALAALTYMNWFHKSKKD